MGLSDANEGDVGATEEFLHIFRVAARVFLVVFFLVIDFDGTNRAEGAFVTEDEVDGFVFDKTIGLVAALSTNFVAKQGIEANSRNDVEFLSKKLIQELEALTFGANHEMFARAVAAALHGFTIATTSGDASENGDKKKQQRSNGRAGKIDLVWSE